MKRGAEKQLTKDSGEGHEDGGEGEAGVMQKADETTLAQRKIRALPKRASQSPAPSLTPSTNGAPPVDSKPKFAGFGGFGSSTNSTPFAFGSSTSTSTTAAQAASGLAAPASSPFGTSSFPSASAAPTVASSASNATKSFASLIGSTTASTSKPSNGTTHSSEDASLKYYTSLRGLNVSLLSTLTKAVEVDPFLDISDLLEQYRKHRVSVQTEFDNASKAAPAANGSSNSISALPLPVPTAPSDPDPSPPTPPIPTVTMPTPPSSFKGFPPPSTAAGSSIAPSGGFTPSFGVSSDTTKSFFTNTTSSSFGPGAFGGSTTSAFKDSATESKPSSFFAPPVAQSAVSDSEQGKDKSESGATTSSAFGKFTNPFATARTSTLFGSSIPEGTAEKTGEAKEEKPKSIFSDHSFLKPSGNSTSSASLFGVSSSTSSPFGSGTTPAFSFGAPASSTTDKDKDAGSKPSGFSFGAAPPLAGSTPSFFSFGAASKPGETSPPGSKTPPVGFSFGVPPPKFELPGATSTAGSSSAEGTPAPDDASSADPFAGGQFDKEGAGEEDEETTHEVKAKLYKLTKDKEGESTWSDMGVGMLRLKKHKTNSKRRIFLRNSSTGKILLNFGLYSGLTPTLSKTVVGLMGHDDAGQKVPYRIRVGKTETATALKDALEREIEFVKASSST